MMRFVGVFVLIIGLGACQAEIPIDSSKLVDAPPGAAEAIALTVRAFGITDGGPHVYWYGPESLVDCPDGSQGFIIPGYPCQTGIQGANGVLIGIRAGDKVATDTPIVHELAHWAWADTVHGTVSIWGANYNATFDDNVPGSRVGDQNIWLRASGL